MTILALRPDMARSLWSDLSGSTRVVVVTSSSPTLPARESDGPEAISARATNGLRAVSARATNGPEAPPSVPETDSNPNNGGYPPAPAVLEVCGFGPGTGERATTLFRTVSAAAPQPGADLLLLPGPDGCEDARSTPAPSPLPPKETTAVAPRPPAPPPTTTTVPPTTTTVPPTTIAPPTTTTPTPSPSSTLAGHIAGMSGSAKAEDDDEWTATVIVEVRTNDGQPMHRAQVVGEWSGAVDDKDTEKTDSKGEADFKVKNLEGGEVTFTVIDVVHDDYLYQPSGNAETTLTMQRPQSDESESEAAGHIAGMSGWAEAEDDDEWTATVIVEIRTAYGRPIHRARVVGEWSGAVDDKDTDKTDRQGVADFKVRNLEEGEVTFTVADVVHDDYLYQPAGNAQTTLTLHRPADESDEDDEAARSINIRWMVGWSVEHHDHDDGDDDEWQAFAMVVIRDDQGRPVRGVRVRGVWHSESDGEDPDKEFTGRLGHATFDMDDLRRSSEAKFVVTDVHHDDYEYHPESDSRNEIIVRR